ncbi:MAG: tripartite tricarboxylate transporter TctB family protein [Bradyrhizobium sp.]
MDAVSAEPRTRPEVRRAAAPIGAGGPGSLRFFGSAVEILVGAVMIAVAGWVWFAAAAIRSSSRGRRGPLAFPRGVALLLAGCSVAMVLRALRRRHTPADRVQEVERYGFVAAAVGMTIVYPLLIGWLGYYIATGLWLPPFLWIAGYRNPLGMLFCSLGFLLFTRVVFQILLGTPMP